MVKPNSRNYYRIILQTSVALLLFYMVIRLFMDRSYVADFEAFCPLGGMQALSSFLITDTLACSMNESQIFMGIALAVVVVLFSKLFCSYLCPVGMFTELLGRIGQKLKVRLTISGMTDRALRSLKYVLLFFTFYFTIKSSELFCKEYDPYYALFSNFGSDVVLWFAIPAIIITVLGSIFIRQFWCKYLCPLGAAANIFANGLIFSAGLAFYWILIALWLKIDWLWPLLGITIMGLILELIRLQGWVTPLFKITRDAPACTACLSCDAVCPMAIKISDQNRVTHLDCHLCGDCLYACPEKDVLQINSRPRRWLPATATVSLILIGLLLSNMMELPTINQLWASEEQLNKAAVFSQSGLKNIKCFGSSSAFAANMKRIPGVLGVATFVKSHSVKVYYDPRQLDAGELKKSIFTPTRHLLHQPAQDADSVSVITMSIDKLFDSYDVFYLTQLLSQTEGIYGFATFFGEPVVVEIFFNEKKITPQQIKSVIERPTVTYRLKEKEITEAWRFKVVQMEMPAAVVPAQEFNRRLFQPFTMTFNDFERYGQEQLAVYQIEMPQAMVPEMRHSLNMLAGHLASDSAIVRFETVYGEQPGAKVFYLKDKLNNDKIYEALTQKRLIIHYPDGEVGIVENPFTFQDK